jgi:hypothetical protein
MSRKHWSADRHGVRQWFGDGQSVIAARKVRMTFAIVVPVLIAIGVVAVAVSAGSTITGKQKLTAATSRFHNRPLPLPMPTTPPAAAGTNCTIVVPVNPLSAQGLATPYQLAGAGCTMANTDTQAFVQATIIDPVTGQLSVYEPLVITRGTTAAVAPAVPTLPAGAVVTIDFGFNGDNLTLVGAHSGRRLWVSSLRQGRCVNGLHGSIFGQVSYCNGPAFFRAANAAIAAGTLKVPAVGTASDGKACPTTRSFTVIDQDQSDNVTSTYLLTASGQTAQDNAANAAALTGSTPVGNGSDNRLLDAFVDPALECTPLTAPDLSNAGTNGTSQALNELQAAVGQQTPIALVPPNDPMTEVNGVFSRAKTNLYRAGFDQPLLGTRTNLTQEATAYCRDMMTTQIASLELDKAVFTAAPAADPAVGNNLFTFLAARLSGSFDNLGCGNLGVTNPISLTRDGMGVAIGVTFSAAASPTASPTAPATASPTASAVAPTPAPSGRTPVTAPPPTAPNAPAATPSAGTP